MWFAFLTKGGFALNTQLLLFDLDGTLLRSDKTISQRTLDVLGHCREKGLYIGISTSRSEQNSLSFLSALNPDILIASGGAVVKCGADYIFTAEFSGGRNDRDDRLLQRYLR